MEWEIFPFSGVGPIKFGMTPKEVEAIIGRADSFDQDIDYIREYRDIDLPIISYDKNFVTEIEAFYDVKRVIFKSRMIFEEPGRSILQFLEQENGGAVYNVGVVLFNSIGITTGRLDQSSPGDWSITAFSQGLWDDRISRFKKITFF